MYKYEYGIWKYIRVFILRENFDINNCYLLYNILYVICNVVGILFLTRMPKLYILLFIGNVKYERMRA